MYICPGTDSQSPTCTFILLVPVKAPRGMDPERGIGTVCEGWVKVPKPGGVKRGWTRHYAVVCDLKVFLYEFATDRASGTSIAHVFDIR